MTEKKAASIKTAKRKTTSTSRKKNNETSIKEAIELLTSSGYYVDKKTPENITQNNDINVKSISQRKKRLPDEYYKYRYLMNANKSAIHISDLKCFIDVDETCNRVIKFLEEDFVKSRELGIRLAKNDLIEVTSEYLNFLEMGYLPSQWYYNAGNKIKMESLNAYVRTPQQIVPDNQGPIVDENTISRVPGVSDEMQHMARFKNGMRPDQIGTSAIEEVLAPGDHNSNPIVSDDIVDRSNPNSFVDPRMTSRKIPDSPDVHLMRSGNYAISNQKELYPYTTDHHELSMIRASSQVPQPHVPQQYNPNQPIHEAMPQSIDPRMISPQQAQNLFQQNQAAMEAKAMGSNQLQVSQSAAGLLQDINL